LWWLAGDRRLGAKARRIIETGVCIVSVVSLIEIAKKASTGQLRAGPQAVEAALRDGGMTVLGLTPTHAAAAARLMGSHPDVYDCLWAGSAVVERAVLLTRDAALLENAAAMLRESIAEA
jgi:PIN domain nuclease of toxin-antitoxin system